MSQRKKEKEDEGEIAGGDREAGKLSEFPNGHQDVRLYITYTLLLLQGKKEAIK